MRSFIKYRKDRALKAGFRAFSGNIESIYNLRKFGNSLIINSKKHK